MTFPCPHCGEILPDDAKCCRACGSDHETGWETDTDYHSVEIPEFLLPDEAGGWDKPKPNRGFRVGLLLVLALLLVFPFGYYIGPEIAGLLLLGIVLAATRVAK